MIRIQLIRQEFNEPFRDVVKGFAEMGYSVKATAQILDMSNSYLDKLCKVYGLNKFFKPVMDRRPECRGKGTPRPKKYSDEYLLSLVRKWPQSVEFRRQAPVDHGTLYYRFPMNKWADIVELANRLV